MKYIGKPPKSQKDKTRKPGGKAAPGPKGGGRAGHAADRKQDSRKQEARKPGKKAETRRPSPPHRDGKPAPQAKARAISGPRPALFGLHAVREAWSNPARDVQALYVTADHAESFPARADRPAPVIVQKDDLDRLLGRDAVHQGVALAAAPLEEVFVQDLIAIGAGKARSVILMLDQVTDPHNVGAILRSACAFGAEGVVMQRRHAPELEGIVAKTASGAAEHIAVAYETNLSRALEELQEAGYSVIGLDEHAEQSLADIAAPEKAVLVLGAEGDGMRRLIREHCDVLVTLPTRKPINSLNVSNAAAVALYALICG